jgi:hypothetical protein
MITVLPIFIKIIKNINYTVTYEIIIRYNSSKNVICHHCGDLNVQILLEGSFEEKDFLTYVIPFFPVSLLFVSYSTFPVQV